MPKKATATKVVAAVAQWCGQKNLSLCSSGLTVAAEPHHTDPEIEAIVTVLVMGDALEHTTVTGGVVLIAVT